MGTIQIFLAMLWSELQFYWKVLTRELPIGKLEKLVDKRTLQLSKYLFGTLPTPPTSLDLTKGLINWGMLGNDIYGDCTIAAAGHLEMVWAQEAGSIFTPSAAQVEKDYFAITGGKDSGCVELTVLKYWKNNGIAGRKIVAYTEIELSNQTHIKLGVALFQGVYIGLALPLSAQAQVGKVWDVVKGKNSAPGSWGGHAVPIIGYDSKYLYCITWGRIQKMTVAFWNAYCDEGYILISDDYLINGKTIDGFNLAQLKADLKLL